MNTFQYVKSLSLFFLLTTGYFLTAKADTVDNFQIYVNQKMILTEKDFDPLSSYLKFLELDSSNYRDTITVTFNHCTPEASGRNIMLKDFEGNVIVKWSFPDKYSIKVMSIPIIDIFKHVAIKPKVPLSLHYYDNQLLPTGILIAPVSLDDISLIKQKTKMKVTNDYFAIWTLGSIIITIFAFLLMRQRRSASKAKSA